MYYVHDFILTTPFFRFFFKGNTENKWGGYTGIYILYPSHSTQYYYTQIKNKMIIWAGEGGLGGVSLIKLPPSHGKSKKGKFSGGAAFALLQEHRTKLDYN